MKALSALLVASVAVGQVQVTISPQQSPYALPRPLRLYSWQACTSETRVRTIAAGQIRQIFEAGGGIFTDPALLPLMVDNYVKSSAAGRMLSILGYGATALAIGSSGVAAYKAQFPGVGNAQTWSYIAIGGGILGAGIPLVQSKLQGNVAAEQATITAGVKAALMLDMSELSTIPAGGCSSNVHRLFIGSGVTSVVKGVLP